LGGSTTKEGNIIIRSLLEGLEGSSTIFGKKNKTSVNAAVFINSTFANTMDFDDFYVGHPGATIVPVALNVGEPVSASGRDVIIAVALSYEISMKIGLGLRPKLERRNIHGDGTWQVFGAVVAASKLIRLNSKEIANAFGIA